MSPAGASEPRPCVFWRTAHVLVGVVLICLPWTRAWENNLILSFYPQIEPVMLSAFFKGAVIGLGIDNVLVGIHDVIQAKFGARRRAAGNFF
ncbi:MAG: hypothetical protein LBT74_01325 [Acidobacteriota bacterium]|nr:hypothetical protein [Acidobacteriota bacterium]